jgi:phospholipase/carboxylesterase
LTKLIANHTQGQPGAPLLLTFHGTGGDEFQFHSLGQQLMPKAHIVSPRGPVSEGGMARFFRRTGEGVYDMADLAQRVADMAAFITQKRHETGASQVFALGYSNGANILAALSFVRPDLVNHIALLHPLIPWAPQAQPGLAAVRVLISAGQRDPICPAPQTENLRQYFDSQGAGVRMHWHPGGHEINRGELLALQEFFAV